RHPRAGAGTPLFLPPLPRARRHGARRGRHPARALPHLGLPRRVRAVRDHRSRVCPRDAAARRLRTRRDHHDEGTPPSRRTRNGSVWQTASREGTRRQAMSYSISALLTRNLHEVFGENDSARRRAAIDEIFTEDCVFYDPSKRVYRGRDEIDRVAGAIRATHPDFRYQPIAGPEELGNGGPPQWGSGRPGEGRAYARGHSVIDPRVAIAAVLCLCG